MLLSIISIFSWVFLGYISFILCERVFKTEGTIGLLAFHVISGYLGFLISLIILLIETKVYITKPSKFRSWLRGF
jgi:hypothetical protein